MAVMEDKMVTLEKEKAKMHTSIQNLKNSITKLQQENNILAKEKSEFLDSKADFKASVSVQKVACDNLANQNNKRQFLNWKQRFQTKPQRHWEGSLPKLTICINSLWKTKQWQSHFCKTQRETRKTLPSLNAESRNSQPQGEPNMRPQIPNGESSRRLTCLTMLMSFLNQNPTMSWQEMALWVVMKKGLEKTTQRTRQKRLSSIPGKTCKQDWWHWQTPCQAFKRNGWQIFCVTPQAPAWPRHQN